jgi:hypothetical protein
VDFPFSRGLVVGIGETCVKRYEGKPGQRPFRYALSNVERLELRPERSRGGEPTDFIALVVAIVFLLLFSAQK